MIVHVDMLYMIIRTLKNDKTSYSQTHKIKKSLYSEKLDEMLDGNINKSSILCLLPSFTAHC